MWRAPTPDPSRRREGRKGRSKAPFSYLCYVAPVERKTLNKAGLAALVVLAPGGMILGGLLAWRAYRKRTEAAAKDAPEA